MQLRTSTSERLALSLDELLDVQLDQVETNEDSERDPEQMEQARDACEEFLLNTTWSSLPEAKAVAAQVKDQLEAIVLALPVKP